MNLSISKNFTNYISFKHVIAALLLLRISHVFVHYSPPGVDITLLGDMVRIYVENWQKGVLIPPDLMPLFGKASFFKFHSALAPILASLEFFLRLDLIQLLKWVTFLGFFLYDLAVLLLLKDFESSWQKCKLGISFNLIICFLLINFATGVPSRYLGSGGGVYIFGAALAVLGTREFLFCCISGNSRHVNGIKSAVFFLVSMLIHPLAIIYQPFFFLFLVVVWFPVSEIVEFAKRNQRNIIKSVLIIGLICVPVLYLNYHSPSEFTKNELVKHFSNVRQGYSYYPEILKSSPLMTAFGSTLFYFLKQFPHFIFFSFFIVFWGKGEGKIHGFLAVILFALFAWNAELIPFIGLAMYPDRLTHFVAIAWGVLLLKQSLFPSFYQSEKRVRQLVGVGLVLIVLGLSSARFIWSYGIQPFNTMYLAKSEETAIRKMASLIEPNTIIETRYQGAGVWIPALIGKPVTAAHVHIANMEDWKKYQSILKRKRPYYFIDSRCMADKTCKKRCDGKRVLFSTDSSLLCR